MISFVLRIVLNAKYLIFFHLFFYLPAYSQTPFIPLDSNYQGKRLIVPANMREISLIYQRDVVQNNKGEKFIDERKLGAPFFIVDSLSSNTGNILIPRVTNKNNKDIYQSSFTFFKIKKWGEIWQPTGKYHNLVLRGSGKVSNTFLSKGFDNRFFVTSSFSSTKNSESLKSSRNESVIAFNPSLDSIIKIKGMGNIDHGDILFLADSLTAFITNTQTPSVFLKFISFEKNNFNNGQLYAYKQSSTGNSGFWIPLPMAEDSLKIINSIALKAGATFFMGLNGMSVNFSLNKIYIAENGKEHFHATLKNCFNSVVALHNNVFKINEEIYNNPFGAILEYDLKSDKLKPLIYGGNFEDYKILSNPTTIKFLNFDGNPFLLINENISGPGEGRAPLSLFKENKVINESWMLDLSVANPDFGDLYRFLIAPHGYQIKGGNFDLDYKNYFFTLYPSKEQDLPTQTFALSGFREKLIKERRLKEE